VVHLALVAVQTQDLEVRVELEVQVEQVVLLDQQEVLAQRAIQVDLDLVETIQAVQRDLLDQVVDQVAVRVII